MKHPCRYVAPVSGTHGVQFHRCGLAAVRNAYGEVHGKDTKYVRPSERHARLAVGVGFTLAEFLIATRVQQMDAWTHLSPTAPQNAAEPCLRGNEGEDAEGERRDEDAPSKHRRCLRCRFTAVRFGAPPTRTHRPVSRRSVVDRSPGEAR